ncbi:MAG: hypothetical protein M9918_20625, partial [Anaerolineae bacterium]|nr:hypothetical protein [Anaerolineae bacterium]
MFKRINWRSLWWLLPGIPLAFFTLFYFYPLLSIFNLSFTTDGKLDLSPLNQLFSTSYYAGLL